MKYFCITFFLLAVLTLHSQQPIYQWTKQIGGPGNSYNTPCLSIDGSSNLVCVGNFNGIIDFDPGPGTFSLNTVNGYYHTSVSKYDPAGNLVWAGMLGGSDLCWGTAIATDAGNNIYVTGYFQGSIDFDPGAGSFSLTSNGFTTWDVFILKLDANGNFVWAKQFGDANAQAGRGIATDVAGNIYTTGEFMGTVDFDPGAGTFNMTASSFSAFILKLDPQGNFVWARQTQALGPVNLVNIHLPASICTGAGGAIYTTGTFKGTMDVDPGAGTYTLATSTSFQPASYTLKLDASGNFLWAMQLGDGSAMVTNNCIAEDGSGNVCVTGSFKSTLDFDPGPGTYTMSGNMTGNNYIQKLTAQGGFIWARQFERLGNSGGSESESIDIDACDDIYSIGGFFGTVDFDPGPASFTLSSTNSAGFLSKLDASGNFAWAVPLNPVTPLGAVSGSRLKLNSSGGLYALGMFSDGVDFDPGPGTDILQADNTDNANSDFYLIKLNSCNSLCQFGAGSSSSGIICSGESATLTAVGAGSYSWQPGPGTATFVVTPTVTTTYTVTSFVEGGCSATALVTQSVSACVSITDVTEPGNLRVYPNPSTGMLYVNGENTGETRITLLNSAGQFVWSSIVLSDAAIDISHLPPGLYLVLCQEKNGAQKTIKLIKE
jgi:hypothetical protein